MPVAAIETLTHPRRKAIAVRFVGKYFYTLMSLLILAVVTYGFSQTVDHNLIHAAVPRPALLWLHGLLFYGWLLFFILQAALVRFHNVKLHRVMGWFGAAMGVGIIVMGIAITIKMVKFHVHQLHETDMSFVLVPFWDTACFAIAFGLAVYWIKRPDEHRRLMLIATSAIAAAGFGRFPAQIIPPGMFYAGVDLLILMGVGRDLLVDRRVNAVYRVALPVLIAGQVFVMYTVMTKPDYWMRIVAVIAR
jgi:hypothetical protein